MTKSDLIYKDKYYEIYKKDARYGIFEPACMFDLVDIGLDGLADWKQCGVKCREDLTKIMGGYVEKIYRLIQKFDNEANL
jgi:hypothetical protein